MSLFSPLLLLSLVLSVAFIWTLRADAPLISRRNAGLGLSALGLLFFLGGIWPSLFTIAALIALPAFFLLVLSLVRPRSLPFAARLYVAIAVLLSPLSYAIQFLWLAIVSAA